MDESYLPDEDIRLFLTDKFQDIRSTHRLCVYASTIIHSIRHKPTDRLDIVLGIGPPQSDLPFAELDALCKYILSRVEDIEMVLRILAFTFLDDSHRWLSNSPHKVEAFLSLQPGDVELYLGGISSLVNASPDKISILHESSFERVGSMRKSVKEAAGHSEFPYPKPPPPGRIENPLLCKTGRIQASGNGANGLYGTLTLCSSATSLLEELGGH